MPSRPSPRDAYPMTGPGSGARGRASRSGPRTYFTTWVAATSLSHAADFLGLRS